MPTVPVSTTIRPLLRAILSLCLVCTIAAADAQTYQLGTDPLPGFVVSAAQQGFWREGSAVSLVVTVADEATEAVLDLPLELCTGAPGIDAANRSETSQVASGVAVPLTVDAARAGHTEVYVTLRDQTGNAMTSRFVLVR